MTNQKYELLKKLETFSSSNPSLLNGSSEALFALGGRIPPN